MEEKSLDRPKEKKLKPTKEDLLKYVLEKGSKEFLEGFQLQGTEEALLQKFSYRQLEEIYSALTNFDTAPMYAWLKAKNISHPRSIKLEEMDPGAAELQAEKDMYKKEIEYLQSIFPWAERKGLEYVIHRKKGDIEASVTAIASYVDKVATGEIPLSRKGKEKVQPKNTDPSIQTSTTTEKNETLPEKRKEKDEKILRLKTLFPGFEDSIITDTLAGCNGDEALATQALRQFNISQFFFSSTPPDSDSEDEDDFEEERPKSLIELCLETIHRNWNQGQNFQVLLERNDSLLPNEICKEIMMEYLWRKGVFQEEFEAKLNDPKEKEAWDSLMEVIEGAYQSPSSERKEEGEKENTATPLEGNAFDWERFWQDEELAWRLDQEERDAEFARSLSEEGSPTEKPREQRDKEEWIASAKEIQRLMQEEGLAWEPPVSHGYTEEEGTSAHNMPIPEKSLVTALKSASVTALKIEPVAKSHLRARFEAKRAELRKKYHRHQPYYSPRLAYHGTAATNLPSIVNNGLLVPGTESGVRHATDEGWYGKGIYLSPNAQMSIAYCRGGGKLLVCAVLMGRPYQCSGMLVGRGLMPGYDSHIAPSGDEYIIFSAAQILPCYLITFQTVSYVPSGISGGKTVVTSGRRRRETKETRKNKRDKKMNKMARKYGGRKR